MVIFYGDGFFEEVFCRIFETVLMNFLNDSFSSYLGLPFFLARCILLTGLSLIPACTSPLIQALRFDSPECQLQCRDTGGTVRVNKTYQIFHKKCYSTLSHHIIITGIMRMRRKKFCKTIFLETTSIFMGLKGVKVGK